MKLCRFGGAGLKRPGILDREGRIRDLSSICADFDPEALSPAGLARLAATDPHRRRTVRGLAFPIAGFQNSSASASIILITRPRPG